MHGDLRAFRAGSDLLYGRQRHCDGQHYTITKLERERDVFPRFRHRRLERESVFIVDCSVSRAALRLKSSVTQRKPR